MTLEQKVTAYFDALDWGTPIEREVAERDLLFALEARPADDPCPYCGEGPCLPGPRHPGIERDVARYYIFHPANDGGTPT